jgi:hypothetical protein
MVLPSLTSSDNINALIRSESSALLPYNDCRIQTPHNNTGCLAVISQIQLTTSSQKNSIRNTKHNPRASKMRYMQLRRNMREHNNATNLIHFHFYRHFLVS